MTVSDWIGLCAIAVTIILFVFAAVRNHAADDRKFQDDTGKEQAKIAEKVRNLENRFETLHDWKNLILPEQFKTHGQNFENQVDRISNDMGRRLDRIERVLNGKLRNSDG